MIEKYRFESLDTRKFLLSIAHGILISELSRDDAAMKMVMFMAGLLDISDFNIERDIMRDFELCDRFNQFRGNLMMQTKIFEIVKYVMSSEYVIKKREAEENHRMGRLSAFL